MRGDRRSYIYLYIYIYIYIYKHFRASCTTRWARSRSPNNIGIYTTVGLPHAHAQSLRTMVQRSITRSFFDTIACSRSPTMLSILLVLINRAEQLSLSAQIAPTLVLTLHRSVYYCACVGQEGIDPGHSPPEGVWGVGGVGDNILFILMNK